MSQTKPLPCRHTLSGELLWRVFSADLPRGGARSARIICRFFSTGEAGQALAYLYSEARLYKGARLAVLSQSATTQSQPQQHSGTVSSLFFPAQINCCT